MKLNFIHAATRLETLLIPPGNRLEALAGDRAGRHSIRINEIAHGRRAVTADTALRLGRFFGMEAEFWMNLQAHYDMEVAQEALGDRLEREVHPLTKTA